MEVVHRAHPTKNGYNMQQMATNEGHRGVNPGNEEANAGNEQKLRQ